MSWGPDACGFGPCGPPCVGQAPVGGTLEEEHEEYGFELGSCGDEALDTNFVLGWFSWGCSQVKLTCAVLRGLIFKNWFRFLMKQTRYLWILSNFNII